MWHHFSLPIFRLPLSAAVSPIKTGNAKKNIIYKYLWCSTTRRQSLTCDQCFKPVVALSDGVSWWEHQSGRRQWLMDLLTAWSVFIQTSPAWIYDNSLRKELCSNLFFLLFILVFLWREFLVNSFRGSQHVVFLLAHKKVTEINLETATVLRNLTVF